VGLYTIFGRFEFQKRFGNGSGGGQIVYVRKILSVCGVCGGGGGGGGCK
jgi:hypothetical protein